MEMHLYGRLLCFVFSIIVILVRGMEKAFQLTQFNGISHCLSVSLSVSLFICLSVCLFVCLSACLSVRVIDMNHAPSGKDVNRSYFFQFPTRVTFKHAVSVSHLPLLPYSLLPLQFAAMLIANFDSQLTPWASLMTTRYLRILQSVAAQVFSHLCMYISIPLSMYICLAVCSPVCG